MMPTYAQLDNAASLNPDLNSRSFSVILEAYDLVTMTDKRLIDRAVHRSMFRPAINSIDQSTEWHHVTITTQLSGYTFSMRLTCQPDHYNDTCAKVCLKNSSQYTCDANGDKICEPGWSGTECDRGEIKGNSPIFYSSCVIYSIGCKLLAY
ncbi:hypothetical protein EG68_12482 [Paragonimus skrjabini miyazakii]|uniref:Delta-like protein n=1 Tax=Paragonimus skrjabini miyazakii TaxID=59628 RepID=A0A8S9YFG8_9TREM|nr:hypothetical protein EG68_12482 [Paragonimus skrjabini miyazakii]